MRMILGIVIGLLIALIGVWIVMPKAMLHVRESQFNFDDTCLKVYEAIQTHGWTVDAIHDCGVPQDSLGNGPKVKVFALCKKELSGAILTDGKNRKMTAVMPCRIGVYERDGKTYISSMRIGLIGRMFGGAIAKYTGLAAKDENAILKGIVKP